MISNCNRTNQLKDQKERVRDREIKWHPHVVHVTLIIYTNDFQKKRLKPTGYRRNINISC